MCHLTVQRYVENLLENMQLPCLSQLFLELDFSSIFRTILVSCL